MSERKLKPTNIGVSVYSFNQEQIISKSDKPTNIEPESENIANEWLEHSNFADKYQTLIDNSTILPQCIRSYKNNIAGFGIGVRYKSDYKDKETAEMIKEYKFADNIIKQFTLEQDTKVIFEQLVNDIESAGIGYLEVIRNNDGLPCEIENITAVDSITKSKKQDVFVTYEYYCEDGMVLNRKKRFRKYRQTVGCKTVYFKEFGDPRVMDKTNGNYLTNIDKINADLQANEIIEIKASHKSYGDIRWIGCIHPLYGSWYAEQLNLNYFKNGRHTPLAICIENGRLTPEAHQKLKQYTEDIKGEKGQHAFLVIETDPIQSELAWQKENPPKVTIKDMASILQKDELFGEYIEKNRRKVQSAFNLPDIYVGYTTDFNRATAYAAMTITEQQIFQPYRDSINYMINHKLLNEYKFKYCEAYLKAPEFNNPDDIKTIFDAVGSLGGITPNFAKQTAYEQLGKDCNDYDFEGADLPLQLAMQQNTQTINQQLNAQIKKAESNGDSDIVPVLKALLKEFKKVKNDDKSENS